MLPQDIRTDYKGSNRHQSYQHNGYLFDLELNKRYLLKAQTGQVEQKFDRMKYLIRTIAQSDNCTVNLSSHT